MGRTVWILGAGFSRPLGGPLLDTLLAPETMADLAAAYSGQYPRLNDRPSQAAVALYNFGIKFKNGFVGSAITNYGDQSGAQLWADAEDFLDTLDLAAQNSDSRAARRIKPYLERFQQASPQSPALTTEQVNAAARRLVSAQCCVFTEGVDLQAERYAPYVRWMQELVAKGDAIISFNYDYVIERLLTHVPGKVNVLRLGQRADNSAAWLFKLHGSINWKRQGAEVIPTQDEHFALKCADGELAIASPGPTKQNVTKQLDPLWIQARNMLASEDTDCIVFVGYRFPPTDANAKQRLLHSIMGAASPYLAVHMVLGPNKVAADVVRLDAMLRYAMRNRAEQREDHDEPHASDKRFNLIVQPMWAEDFFTVVNLDILKHPSHVRKPVPNRV